MDGRKVEKLPECRSIDRHTNTDRQMDRYGYSQIDR